jgi:ABC-type lipoprotein export system ATPase subunit
LAVSAFQRSPTIFLDETINNLDQDAIGRVADLIASVIKKQTKSLYVVTHSETIQTMSLWNEIVELD